MQELAEIKELWNKDNVIYGGKSIILTNWVFFSFLYYTMEGIVFFCVSILKG
jgi:hypothetical protein